MFKELLESIAEIENDIISEEDEETNAKIKLSIPLVQLLDLFFDEENSEMGRIVLGKIIRGDEANLTLRERGIIANAFVRIFKPIATDRTIYNRIVRKMDN